jgi:hypothetical protein
MSASPQAAKHQWASQCNTLYIITAFSRRRSVREGVIEIVSHDFLFPAAAHRVWISSSISTLTQTCFCHCTSLTSVTFESNSKLRRMEDGAFAQNGLRTIEIPASVEIVCKFCFSV